MKNTKVNYLCRAIRRLYPKPDIEGLQLEMKYPYKAHYDRETVVVEFRDFPSSEEETGNKCDYYTNTADKLALNYLGACHTKLWHANDMIPMPSKAIEGEHYAHVPERVALIILKRNWEIAKTYREAAALVAEEQRRTIRRGLDKQKGTK